MRAKNKPIKSIFFRYNYYQCLIRYFEDFTALMPVTGSGFSRTQTLIVTVNNMTLTFLIARAKVA